MLLKEEALKEPIEYRKNERTRSRLQAEELEEPALLADDGRHLKVTLNMLG
jgi:hypothetical protein